MSTQTFVEQLYTKFLSRDADADGKAYWMDVIDNSAQSATEVTWHFLNSAEFGDVVTPIARLYYAAFDRIPDQDGLDYWVAQAQGGLSQNDIAHNFLVSNEFESLYGSDLSDSDFVEQLYLNVLGRASDEGGKQYWVSQIESGTARADVLRGFSNSAELCAAKDGDVNTTVTYYGILSIPPTPAQLATASTMTNKIQLINQLYTDASYSGEAVPGSQGTLIDGYISGATVFVDYDGDGVLDTGELSTTTDDSGNFDLISGGAPLVAIGGTDISTGAAFEGIFTAPAGSTVINPLTTLIQTIASSLGTSATAAMAVVAERLGLDSSINLRTFDPIAEASRTDTTAAAQQLAIQVHSAAIQVTTILSQTAAVLDGTGAVDDEQAGAQATINALAELFTSSNQPAGAIDITDTTILEAVINNAAIEAGADATTLTAVAAVAADTATTTSNLNVAIDSAVTAVIDGGGDITAALTDIAQIQIVAETIEDSLETGAELGDVSSAVTDTTGDTLDAAVAAAEDDVGSITQDDVTDTTTTPTTGGGGGAPAATFTVDETAGVVSFGGTATGNITLAWAGAVAGSVATFTRAAVVATTTADWAGTATSIALAAGEVLSATAANVTGVTISGGTGTVTLTDTTLAATALNTLDGTIAGTLNAATVTTISGTVANVKTAIASAGITTATNYAVTLSDGGVSVADANTVDADTTGVITATITEGDLTTLAGLTGTGNAYTVSVTDTGATATELNTLDGKTTVALTTTAVTTIESSAVADVKTMITAAATTGIDGDWTVTLSDTSLSGADVKIVNAASSGAIDISAATTITSSTVADVLEIVNNTGAVFTTAGNYA
ncbi:MAG: DUF4214 domain-containing protein, partial [Desulfobulbaceae bacterium]|nr:DUF4214 domain-containing protein [Desulfobulbaceae bacterium]